jgi:hypothetical protein
LPVTAAISPPLALFSRPVKVRISVSVPARADSASVRRFRFCSTSRASATILGISADTSPRSTMRSLAGRQRRVVQHAGEGAQARGADEAFFEREHAGRTQPVRRPHRHVDVDAHRASLDQLDTADATDGKAGKGHVHADHHAFGIVGRQVQLLRRLEGAAHPHQVQHRGADEQRHQDQQQRGAKFQRAL